MSIRMAILGLLADQPLHGYAIQAALEERLGDLCEPSFGEVYRVLAALTRDGLVVPASARVGNRPRRKVYTPTAAGHRVLMEWLREGGPASGRARDDEPWLRVLIADRCRPEVVPEIIGAEVRRRRAELAELSSLRGVRCGPASTTALVHALRLEGDVLLARARLTVAELCSATLARHRTGATVATLVREMSDRGAVAVGVDASPRRWKSGGPTGR